MAELLTKIKKPTRRGAVALWVVLGLVVLWLAFHIGDIVWMFGQMGGYLSYKFIQRALIVGTLVSLTAALLGVSLVLKRYSMIGDGLSHVGFGALTVAMALGFVTADALPAFLPVGLRSGIASLCGIIAAGPLPFTLVIVVLCAFALLRLSGQGGMGGDSAIALISTSALALGVVVTSMTSGMNVDVYNYMFGSILAMSDSDVWLSVILSGAVLILFVLFYPRIFAVTFDERFARATGMQAGLYNHLIALLTAVTVVIGMRMMGTLLISSLIIFPALSAMRVFKRFRSVVVFAGVLAVGCFCLGLVGSYLLSTPVGATVVLCDLAAFLICAALGRAR